MEKTASLGQFSVGHNRFQNLNYSDYDYIYITWGWGISIDCEGGDVTTCVRVTPADAAGMDCVLTNGEENSDVTWAVELEHDVTSDVGPASCGFAMATDLFTCEWYYCLDK